MPLDFPYNIRLLTIKLRRVYMSNKKRILRKIRITNLATIFIFTFLILAASFPLWDATADNVDVLELSSSTAEHWRKQTSNLVNTYDVKKFERSRDNISNTKNTKLDIQEVNVEVNAMDIDTDAPIFSYMMLDYNYPYLTVDMDVEDELSNVAGGYYQIINSNGITLKNGTFDDFEFFNFDWDCSVYGGSYDSTLPSEFNTQSCYPLYGDIDLTGFNNGTYTLELCAKDTLNNIGYSSMGTIPTGINDAFCFEGSFVINREDDHFEASVDKDIISPNNDGIDDVATISYSISHSDSNYEGVQIFVTDDVDYYSATLANVLYLGEYNGEDQVEWDGQICDMDDYISSDPFACSQIDAPDGDYYIIVLPNTYNYDAIVLPITVDRTVIDTTVNVDLVLNTSTPQTAPAIFNMTASSDEIVKFEWDLNGDGIYDDATIVADFVSTIDSFPFSAGTYTLGVKVTDQAGNIGYAEIQVEVIQEEFIVTLVKDKQGVLPIGSDLTISMVVLGGEDPFSYIWSGDCSGTDNYFDFTNLAAGTYTCTVEVTDAGYRETTDTISFTVENSVPIVEIKNVSINNELTEGDYILLYAEVVEGNAPFSYLWSGDCSGTDSTVEIVDTLEGSYTCTVVVTDADGDTASDEITVFVGNNAPVVLASINIPNPVEGDDVVVYADILFGGNAPFTYLWSGDCSGINGFVELDNIAVGEYRCTVEVTDADGDKGDGTIEFTVANNIPEVSIEIYPLIIKEYEKIDFRANVVNGNPDFVYSWGGECSGGESKDFTLKNGLPVGIYTCTVAITDVDGDTDIASYTFVVKDNVPVVKITASPKTEVYVGTVVTLTAKITGGNVPITGLWSGACSGSKITAKLPSTEGLYKCTYTIMDGDNDMASDTITVKVIAKPYVPPVKKPKPVVKEDTLSTEKEKEGVDKEVKGVQDEKDLDVKESNEEICESSKLTGRLYTDKNGNDQYDKGEEVFEKITLKVYLLNEVGDKELVAVVTTDNDGIWEIEGCEGKYMIDITDGIEDKFEVLQDEDGFEFKDSSIELAVDVADKGNFLWLWVLGGISILFIGIVFLFKNINE